MQASTGGHDAGKVFKRPFFFLSLKKKGERILKRGDPLGNCKELIQGILKEKSRSKRMDGKNLRAKRRPKKS
jgi:hypothetical protein